MLTEVGYCAASSRRRSCPPIVSIVARVRARPGRWSSPAPMSVGATPFASRDLRVLLSSLLVSWRTTNTMTSGTRRSARLRPVRVRRLPLLRLLHRLATGVPVLALALSFGGLGHGGGVYRRRNRTEDRGGSLGTIAGRELARAEVRRHLGRRSRPHPRRRRAHRAHPARRRRRRGRGLGHGQDHRRPRAPRPRGLERARPPARWTCSSPRASASRSRCSAWRSSTSARPRSRSPVRRPASSPTPRTARPRSWRSAATASARRSTAATSRWSPGSRACRPSATSPRSGRGGSDTTAVALAAALGADVCEIYTDVAGVYTADPRIVPDARRLDRLSYDEMLEMSATGGRVLALRSVEFAAQLRRARARAVELHVGDRAPG